MTLKCIYTFDVLRTTAIEHAAIIKVEAHNINEAMALVAAQKPKRWKKLCEHTTIRRERHEVPF